MAIIHQGTVLFSDNEIRSKGNGEIRLATGFDDRLAELRLAFGEPMRVTSFCRDQAHNEREGGHPSSAHLTHNTRWLDNDFKPLGTFGLDVAFPNSGYLARLVKAAFGRGWCVGVNFEQRFVHLDQREIYTTKLGPVLFGY